MKQMKRQTKNGFTLIEMMVALAVFLSVSAIVMSGMVQMVKTQGTVANRTEMHTSVRSATELLQQEIGQAGRISLPAAVLPVTMTGATTGGGAVSTVAVSCTTNMFQGMLLDVDTGGNFEVATVTGVTPGCPGSITATFQKTRAVGTYPVAVSGAFGTGIVPPAPNLPCATAGYTGWTPSSGTGSGSNCTTLKLYGDINGDGNILYVEYSCDTSAATPTNPAYLYRNEVANAVVLGTTKPAVDATMYLINNLQANPNQAYNGCFNYQVQNAGTVPYVTDVALTLTVQTQMWDSSINGYPKETKALLNITPRNVYYVWETTSLGEVPRNQPMPPNIYNLL